MTCFHLQYKCINFQMETEESIQQQITKLEHAHLQLQSKSLKLNDQIQNLEDTLVRLNSDIERIVLPHQRQPHETIEKVKIQQLQQQIKRLEGQYLSASEALAQTTDYDHQVSLLVEAQRSLKDKLLQTVSINDSDLKTLQTQIQKCKQSIDQQSHKKLTLEAEIKRQSQSLVNIQKQIDSIIIQPIDKIENEKGVSERNNLEKQISLLQKHLSQVESHICDENDRKKNEQEKVKNLIQNSNKQLSSLKIQISEIEKQHSTLTEKFNQERVQINSEISINLAKAQAEVSQKEAEKQSFIKKIQLIMQELKIEDERIKNEQKNQQNKKNIKDLIKKAEGEALSLKNQKQSLQGLYNRLIATKKGYVNIQNLQILQRQLQRHQKVKGPSSQVKENEFEKLKKHNNGLKEAIKRLNRLRQQIETREEKNLSDVKKKKDTLNIQKLQLDKDLAEANFKVNQYIKHFPNHEIQKEAKKKTKLKKTNSINGQFQLPKEKKKKQVEEQTLQFKILGEDEEEEVHNSSRRQSYGTELLKNTKWYKRRSSDNFEIAPDKPLYQNTYFLAAAGLLLILIIAALK